MSGFVYFIRCSDRVKIGYSADPAKRLTKINSDAPYPCELIGYVSADDFPEREIHERFAEARVHSEWFLATAELLAFVAKVSIAGAMRSSDRFSRADIDSMPPLKAWRYRNRMNGKEAAAALNVSQAFLSRIEAGAYKVPPTRALHFESVTGISRHILRPDIYGPAPQPEAVAS